MGVLRINPVSVFKRVNAQACAGPLHSHLQAPKALFAFIQSLHFHFSDSPVFTVLSLSSLVLSSACSHLPLNLSSECFPSVIALFSSRTYFWFPFSHYWCFHFVPSSLSWHSLHLLLVSKASFRQFKKKYCPVDPPSDPFQGQFVLVHSFIHLFFSWNWPHSPVFLYALWLFCGWKLDFWI